MKTENKLQEENWTAVFPMIATIAIVAGVMYLAERWGILQKKSDTTIAIILLSIIAFLVYVICYTIYKEGFKSAVKVTWVLAIIIALIPAILLVLFGVVIGLGKIVSACASIPLWALIIIFLLLFRR